MSLEEKSKPSFSDYYISQIISLTEKGRRITKNKRTGKTYEEVNFRIHQMILFILVFAIIPIGAIILNSATNGYEERTSVYALCFLIAILIASLYPFASSSLSLEK
jgi:uncharacterized Tic20 family protein